MIHSKRAQDKYRTTSTGVFSPAQVKELIQCQNDPKHFIQNHLAVMNHAHLPIALTLRQEQSDYIDAIHTHHSIVCKHPRQAGISTATLAYLLWQSQFSCDKTIGVVLPSIQHATSAKNILRTMYSNISEYLRSDIKLENQSDIEFDNGSRIVFRGASEHVGRGSTLSTLYLGDLAYVDPVISHLMWLNLIPCLGTGSKFIIHSTPHDKFNLFHDVWSEAVQGNVPIHPHSISFWDLHDASQAKWDALNAMLGDKVMRRSYGCEFVL